ncbi:MAG: hypothetical protein LBS69_03660 [Prevotellaceae bacterium]|jgi:hypothetical protein|nr:hypothetical protein [Prevotellaceae bacterium]
MYWKNEAHRGDPFYKRCRNFSDTDYNELVTALGFVTRIDKDAEGVDQADAIVIHFASKDAFNQHSARVKAAINTVLRIGGYNPNTASVENWSTCVSGTVTDRPGYKYFRYKTLPSGNKDLRRTRANKWILNLLSIKASGKITSYDSNNPLVGIILGGKRINLTRVNNNSAYTNPNETPAIVEVESDSFKIGSATTDSIFTTSNILIAAGVLILLFVVFRKKKSD